MSRASRQGAAVVGGLTSRAGAIALEVSGIDANGVGSPFREHRVERIHVVDDDTDFAKLRTLTRTGFECTGRTRCDVSGHPGHLSQDMVATTTSAVVIGRLAFGRAEHAMRVRGTLGQH